MCFNFEFASFKNFQRSFTNLTNPIPKFEKSKNRQKKKREGKSVIERLLTRLKHLACRVHGRFVINAVAFVPFSKRGRSSKRKRLHPGHPLQSATSASMMIAVDREERLARRQGHEHTPGELWSAATPTSWSSKHRLPRILMDPRLRDGSTPSTTPPPLEITPTNIQSRLRAAPRSIIIPRQIR